MISFTQEQLNAIVHALMAAQKSGSRSGPFSSVTPNSKIDSARESWANHESSESDTDYRLHAEDAGKSKVNKRKSRDSISANSDVYEAARILDSRIGTKVRTVELHNPCNMVANGHIHTGRI